MKITFDAKSLRAAIHCAAKKDVRFYLNGVLVHVNSTKALTVCATQGHVMFACNVEYCSEGEAFAPGFQIIVPYETIKALPKPSKYGDIVTLESLPDGSYMLGNSRFIAIDGRFPDYRRVIPSIDAKAPSEPNHYNPEYLVTCNDALRTFFNGPKTISYKLTHLEGSGVVHDGRSDAVCVVMPLRGDAAYQGFFNNSDLDA